MFWDARIGRRSDLRMRLNVPRCFAIGRTSVENVMVANTRGTESGTRTNKEFQQESPVTFDTIKKLGA